MAPSIRLVLTNCPDADTAERLARRLVEQRLAACVNLLSPCRSLYEWDGKVCDEQEFPLLIKTTTERYAALEAEIRELHPYEVPEIVAVDLADGSAPYLQWVMTQASV